MGAVLVIEADVPLTMGQLEELNRLLNRIRPLPHGAITNGSVVSADSAKMRRIGDVHPTGMARTDVGPGPCPGPGD
jgi:hypothetical protein